MFETIVVTLESVKASWQLIFDLRSIYQACKLMQVKLALYQAGTDPAFNATINAIFSVQERQELGNILSDINTMVTDWETNHRAAIGLS